MISDIHLMKTLIVVRHAKSSWNEPGTDDLSRPLNNRGKKDAPEMAKRLRKRGIPIDLFLSSPAQRAFTTARYFADEYKVGKKDIAVEEKLYNAAPDTFYEVLSTLSDEYKTIALFSHNPGITDFVNTLTQVRVDEMPTCAVYAVTADPDKWAFFEDASKHFLFFDYPKNPLAG
jgi:phosphohistidine phosphatase